jgi:hypothetical protein
LILARSLGLERDRSGGRRYDVYDPAAIHSPLTLRTMNSRAAASIAVRAIATWPLSKQEEYEIN